ncbi:MAG: hypothetical protein GF398_05870 [Chitinivibrionales bacterium]|nr:hypothetical protein [Chitinivibrionales bacterium]
MEQPFEVWADTEYGFVEQRVTGHLTEEHYDEMVRQTGKCAEKLGTLDEIRILVWAGKGNKPGPKIRKKSMERLQDPTLKKMALWDAGAVMRTFFKFISIASGSTKARAFATREKAINWLTR